MIMVIVMFIAIMMYLHIPMMSITSVVVNVLFIVIVYPSVIVSAVAIVIASVFVIVALHNRRIFLMFGLRLSIGSTCHRCTTWHQMLTAFNWWWIFEINGLRFHLLIERLRMIIPITEHFGRQKNTHRTWLQDPPRNWCKSWEKTHMRFTTETAAGEAISNKPWLGDSSFRKMLDLIKSSTNLSKIVQEIFISHQQPPNLLSFCLQFQSLGSVLVFMSKSDALLRKKVAGRKSSRSSNCKVLWYFDGLRFAHVLHLCKKK